MSNLVYILLEDGEIIGVYSIESNAIADAKLYNLKSWYILARGLK